jgi:aminoglycoside phosphotransferase (APT) family kinase protein
VQNAVDRCGVPTASPVVVEADASWLGVPFIVMPFVDGDIPGPASLFDPWLTEATAEQRRDAQREMVRVLAAVHAVDWRAAGLEELLAGGRGRLDEQIDRWGDYLRWAMGAERMPRIEAILEWCRRHRPEDTAAPSLVWGDPRLGNLVMDEQRRTRAVLDWELATIGPAEMDLGWYLGLERVLHELGGKDPLPGFAGPDEVAHDYEVAIGRPLEDPAWHQIFAVFRSISINVRQAAISARAGVEYLIPPGEANPLVGIVEGWIADHPGA